MHWSPTSLWLYGHFLILGRGDGVFTVAVGDPPPPPKHTPPEPNVVCVMFVFEVQPGLSCSMKMHSCQTVECIPSIGKGSPSVFHFIRSHPPNTTTSPPSPGDPDSLPSGVSLPSNIYQWFSLSGQKKGPQAACSHSQTRQGVVCPAQPGVPCPQSPPRPPPSTHSCHQPGRRCNRAVGWTGAVVFSRWEPKSWPPNHQRRL